MTEQDCLDLFERLAAAYPKERMTDAQITLYTEVLAPYEVRDVAAAAALHIQKSPFFPRISDLVGALTRRDALDADEAWGQVQRAIRHYGRNPGDMDLRIRSTDAMAAHMDPVVWEVVQAMGWSALCDSDNPEADRAHFVRFYERARERHRDSRLLRRSSALPGVVREAIGQIGHPEAVRGGL